VVSPCSLVFYFTVLLYVYQKIVKFLTLLASFQSLINIIHHFYRHFVL